jgi:uncharacterized protein (TIGR00303 family)
MIKTILGDIDFIESLRGKKATFLLSLAHTKTNEIPGITQAGIPGKIYLTPALDSEFLCTGEVRSLEDIAQTPKGVPTPALITRAIHLLKPFSNIQLLDLGLEVKPNIKYFDIHNFDMKPSNRIDDGANINALEIFQKAVEFGKNYQSKEDYIILAESTPAGTTTALATALALGYKCQDMFSSSFKNVPNDIKNTTIKKALLRAKQHKDIFDIVGCVADNMLIFNAGFILGCSYNKTKILLAGGTQMASVLLLVNSIVNDMGGLYDSSNIALCTTSWVANDKNSDIKSLLKMLDFKINAYYSNFDFSLSEHMALKLYDDGEAKEGVGAGGALVYASLNGLGKEQITKKVEEFLR